MADVQIRIRSWIKGTDADAREGLVGFLSLFYGDLILDGVTVRRTAEGKMTLSFPERRDRQGRRHPYFRPIDQKARLAIEKAVFAAATVAEAVE